MFIKVAKRKWQRKTVDLLDKDDDDGKRELFSFSVVQSFRDEEGNPRQRHIAYLGSFISEYLCPAFIRHTCKDMGKKIDEGEFGCEVSDAERLLLKLTLQDKLEALLP